MKRLAGALLALFSVAAYQFPAAAEDTITVGMATGVNQVPSLAAQAQGFFKDEGLTVALKPVERGNLAVEAIVSGSMQFAEVSDATFLSAVDKGIQLVALGAASRGFTGKMVAAPGLADVTSLADLKGKRIGIQVGTGVHNVFMRLIKKEGFTDKDFNISNVRVTDMPTAMASTGTFDAVLGWDPMMQRIVQAGYGKEVIGAASLQTMAGITYPLLLVASKDYVAKNEEAVQKFVNAYAHAHQWIRQNPEAALDLYVDTITKAGAPMDKEIVRTMMFEVDKFGGVRFIDSDVPELQGSADFLHETQVLSAAPDVKTLMEPSFAAAADEKFK